MTTQRADVRGLVDEAEATALGSISHVGSANYASREAEAKQWTIEAFDKIRAALSAPGEPVAWMGNCKHPAFTTDKPPSNDAANWIPLYLSPHAHAELTPAPVKVAPKDHSNDCRLMDYGDAPVSEWWCEQHDCWETECIAAGRSAAPVPVPAAEREEARIEEILREFYGDYTDEHKEAAQNIAANRVAVVMPNGETASNVHEAFSAGARTGVANRMAFEEEAARLDKSDAGVAATWFENASKLFYGMTGWGIMKFDGDKVSAMCALAARALRGTVDDAQIAALKFYADPASWKQDAVDIGVGEQPIPGSSPAEIDSGQVASAALQAALGGKE